MKGMIFSAGVGSRLGAITASMPKALVEVGGVPMLERVIMKMKDAGIDDITVNVHHHASQIVNFLKANDKFGIDIHVSDETGLLLDTGGGLLKAAHWLDGNEPVLLHNADILTDFSIPAMLDAHFSTGADATLLVDSRDSSRCLYFDADGRMRGWGNLKTGETRFPDGAEPSPLSALKPLSFGGVHIINPATLLPALREYAGPGEIKPFSITNFYIAVCSRLKIMGFTPVGQYAWYDIGRPETLAAARNSLS